MQLWRIDIVEGVQLVDPVTGVLSEAKVVTGVDDHSRYRHHGLLSETIERTPDDGNIGAWVAVPPPEILPRWSGRVLVARRRL